jgi:predicted metal-dependent HD superfamily phosphohydrolase
MTGTPSGATRSDAVSARRRAEARPVEVVEFRDTDPEPVLVVLRRLAAAHEGWANLQPGIHPDDEPPAPSGIGALFAATSPSFRVPVATWVVGRMGRHGPAPDSIGLQHGTGPRVVARLAAAGVVLPTGWRWRQDHPRRGLVVEIPPGTDVDEVVSWLIRAADVLTLIPLTGDWRAEIHGGPDPAAGTTASAPPDDIGEPGDRPDRLATRWRALVDRWSGSSGADEALFEHLMDLYGAPRRAYHDAAHVEFVLDGLDRIEAEPADRTDGSGAVELAAWFHDAVLEPLAGDNEQRSAELAEARLPALGVPPEVVTEVVRLVLLTASHVVADDDRNGAALVDADLAVLASTPGEYERYRLAVRREYGAVSDVEFRPGRAVVLRALLSRPLYRTRTMAPLEARARANAEGELAALGTA